MRKTTFLYLLMVRSPSIDKGRRWFQVRAYEDLNEAQAAYKRACDQPYTAVKLVYHHEVVTTSIIRKLVKEREHGSADS
jgi:hypothetical protein